MELHPKNIAILDRSGERSAVVTRRDRSFYHGRAITVREIYEPARADSSQQTTVPANFQLIPSDMGRLHHGRERLASSRKRT